MPGRLIPDIPYSEGALSADLRRLEGEWEECQASRERDAIYRYLSAVFDLVSWWAHEGKAARGGR
jgi:hypothetical protein